MTRNAPAKPAPAPVETPDDDGGGGSTSDRARALYAALDQSATQLSRVLPPSMPLAAFVGACRTAILANPKLALAERRSFIIAAQRAAADGLLPDGKEAVFNIYNTKVKDGEREVWIDKVEYLPMVAGIIKRLYETGLVTFIDAAAVYEKDAFEFTRGDEIKLVHRPTLDDDPGKIIAAYVVVKLKNGETKREVMPRRDIEKVRAASKAADGPGWSKWYDQFAIKAVIKRAYKQLPKSADLDRLFEHDNRAMGFEPVVTHTPEAPSKASATPLALEHAPGEPSSFGASAQLSAFAAPKTEVAP